MPELTSDKTSPTRSSPMTSPSGTAARPAGEAPAKPLELKATLTLPQTDFPMKANLPQNEPARLKQWTESDIYALIRATRQGAEKYILHDGPPYANGPIHLGHALNKCIKDFVVKSKTMAGYDAPYVPGWDCHGLPIEIKVDEQLGRKKHQMPAISVRRACREYAQKYLNLQRSQFERLGIFGRWRDPYSTMDLNYESKIVETFYDFFERDFVYKGLRPVYWCIHDRTALAEAEVEYEMHTSPSVYVRYALTSDPAAIHPALDEAALRGKKVYTIIWTTTPWTLPASLAVAFNPELEYVALEQGSSVYIVADALAASTREACNLQQAIEVARFKGSVMDRVTFQHPFLDRSVLGVLASYVTTEQGTGAVHTAPAHGADDFYTGERYGLPQLCDVDNGGFLRNGLAEYEGLSVFEANAPIIELLKSRGALMGRKDIYHSYPHCWRCHNPIIFRATEQWFIGMETPMTNPDGSTTTYRQHALDEIGKVVWDPAWGKERISNMIATRPDWCISRQRIWGVPIAVFLCTQCQKPLKDAGVNKSIVELFAREGADAWYIHEPETLLPAGTTCECGGTAFTKEMDILDVWFESGSSWHAVLETDPELRWPADLYAEGGDQHRGWFHSSLLASVAIRDRAPYKMVATIGWTLDEQGRAFSKSLGNGVDPVDVANRLGGEIVRLWVGSVDFREDVAASENLMQRVGDNYRKLRNTFRFLLGNLHGFDATKPVEFKDMRPLDQYMLARTREVTARILGFYEAFEFHRVSATINEFAVVDLSSMYLDVLKDRMYTFAPTSLARRSAQTVMYKITEALARLVAPILSFTAEEVWSHLPHLEGREGSVHVAHFPALNDLAPAPSERMQPETYPAISEENDWSRYVDELRPRVLAALEIARSSKKIGKALEARVMIPTLTAHSEAMDGHLAELAELFNVSKVSLVDPGSQWSGKEEALPITVEPAEGVKCERCWRYTTDTSDYGAWHSVCQRCQSALSEMKIEPPESAA